MTSTPISLPARVSSPPISIDGPLWLAALGLALGDAVAMWWLGWSIAPRIPLSIAVAVVGFVVVAVVASRAPGLAWLTAPCLALAVLCLLVNAAWIATFITTTSPAPLQDAAFAAADRALGFSSSAWEAWSRTHPAFDHATAVAYDQHLKEAVLLTALLATRRGGGAGPFLSALLVTFLVALVISAAVPAIGTAPNAEWAPAFTALRAGTFTRIDRGEALISMPSFHAAFATLSALACWRFRWVRWPGLLFNFVMIVGTLRWGHHYLVDVLAGVVLALGAAWATGLSPRHRADPNAHAP